ncbi:MAG: MBL fold metallo-hydrolase [Lachnospiraceae bacterium]|nr:MBL fold metallo-hydrolase [Lachnospiraceae bacterium]
MRVTFIQHSCFLVELKQHVLLFDYFPAGDYNGISFGGKLPKIDPSKRLYVFASHSHGDHFRLDVLKWIDEWPDIQYVLSKDCKRSGGNLEKNGINPEVRNHILYVTPLHTYRLDDLVIKTLRSTDAGVAFYIEVEDKHIYHAGDLNWWSTGNEHDINANVIGAAYRRELARIADNHIDIAFVVLDGRLGNASALGMKYFLEHMDADVVFPMHMWREYEWINKLKRIPELSRLQDKVVDIDRENIIFNLED